MRELQSVIRHAGVLVVLAEVMIADNSGRFFPEISDFSR